MTGTVRQAERLIEKRIKLNGLYEKTPRLYPNSRQIARRDIQLWCKELTQADKQEKRKLKRNKKKSGETATTVS